MTDATVAKQHAPKGRIKARLGDNPSPPLPITCTAHSSRTGKPCRLRPMNGGTVCASHGGKAPQVMRKAEERLLEMQPTALRRLNELMEQTEFPSVAIAATKDVLDRTMGKALERHESGKPGDFAQLSDEELRAKLLIAITILDAS